MDTGEVFFKLALCLLHALIDFLRTVHG